MKPSKCVEYNIKNGTSATRKHLRQIHPKIELADRLNLRIEKTIKDGEKITKFLHRMDRMEPPNKRFKPDERKRLLIEAWLRFIIKNNLSFSLIEDRETRALLSLLSDNADSLLPSTHNTIATALRKSFEFKRGIIKGGLQTATSTIHLSIDLWTSSNHLALLGVNAHFTSEEWGLQKATLALKEIEGGHTGENIAGVLYEVLDTYGIIDKLSCIMADNALNNDIAVSCLSNTLELQHLINWEPKTRRLRCSGHVINLAVMAFLSGKHPDARTGTVEVEELENWVAFGPLKKLHHIVVWVAATPQRRKSFRILCEKDLKRDSSMRWNSWHGMIERAIVLEVKRAIKETCEAEAELTGFALSKTEWETLTDIHEFLEPFQKMTKLTESPSHTIDRVLPMMEFLLEHFERYKIKWEDNSVLRRLCETGWAKLDEYFQKTDVSPIYAAAIVLDPTWKWMYFETNWVEYPDWIAAVRNAVRRLWEDNYKFDSTPDYVLRLQSTMDSQNLMNSIDDIFTRRPEVETLITDELEQYCTEPRITRQNLPQGENNLLNWWREAAQRRKYPALSLMAIDILSIPAQEAETEREFSSAKLMITDQHMRLTAGSIEMIQCLKSWDKSPSCDRRARGKYYILYENTMVY